MNKDMMKPTIVLLVICLVAAAALAGTYQFTKPMIDEINARMAAEARMTVLSTADNFEQMDVELKEGVSEVYKATNGAGVVITSAFKGFGGPVTVMTGFDAEGKITGVTVTDASDETPGLGSKATLPAYTDQFVGATTVKFGDVDGDATRIDGVSGATYTSTAVFNAVDAAVAQFAELGGAF
ncbi:MAG: FMN-binding protein [Firmicutes bacterium]|nr:FMN-binding protein [Bacillota bacterium]